ncbi:hypothetical protein [Clostridium saccharoperbutylacetonicum]|uniref:hypothetical protein n=1 Tax=Clostridium saccharoperbutylacetonicum TaxID=36745 RepID=UPI0039E899DD
MLKLNLEDTFDFMTNQQVSRMESKLKEIKMVSEEQIEGQHNNRYSKIISALTDIEQSYLEEDEERKILIQLLAQTKLNEGIDSILRDYIKRVSFFVEWEERSFSEKLFGSVKYSKKNVEINLNQLCNDYVYLKNGITTLIKLKVSQGIEKEKMSGLIEKLNGLDELIENNKIYNWLAIETELNSWQHKLLYGDKYESHLLNSYYTNLEEDENSDNIASRKNKISEIKRVRRKSLIKKIINKLGDRDNNEMQN